MPTEAWPAGYDRVVLAEVDSTMAEAARRAPELTRPTWIMALNQTAARGRRGRAWQHPKGNFAVTLVVPRPGSAMEAAQRSFVIALALDHLFQMYLPKDRIALKWPNDVLIDGRKAAGILLEASGAGQGPDHLAIGVGINLKSTPPVEHLEEHAVTPIALSDAGVLVDPETALSGLALGFDRFETVFRKGGFKAIRPLWLARAARLGTQITARTGQQSVSGIFETVDETGNLVLLTPKGPQAIPAADVYF